MTFRIAALIHKHATQQQRRIIIPGVSLAAAAIVAVVSFVATPVTVQADEVRGEATPPADCSGMESISLTAAAERAVQQTSASSSSGCSFSLELGSLPPVGSEDRPVGSEPCTVTASPTTFSESGATVRIAPQGDCNGVLMRWRVYPPDRPLGDGVLAYSSGQSSAQAYLLAMDAFGIDMIKNWSKATWTYNSERALTVRSTQKLWGTTHKIHALDLYLGDGWTIEYKTWGQTRHGARVEAWSIGHFHVRLRPLLPDSRAQTRSELHVGSRGSFFCDYELRWTNNYAFTSESECTRN